MIIEDDRTPQETFTHDNIVVGHDTFLSGWGKAESGTSYAGWACRAEDLDKVREWVTNRSDIRRVKVQSNAWKPWDTHDHYHIYVVNDGHPALC